MGRFGGAEIGHVDSFPFFWCDSIATLKVSIFWWLELKTPPEVGPIGTPWPRMAPLPPRLAQLWFRQGRWLAQDFQHPKTKIFSMRMAIPKHFRWLITRSGTDRGRSDRCHVPRIPAPGWQSGHREGGMGHGSVYGFTPWCDWCKREVRWGEKTIEVIENLMAVWLWGASSVALSRNLIEGKRKWTCYTWFQCASESHGPTPNILLCATSIPPENKPIWPSFPIFPPHNGFGRLFFLVSNSVFFWIPWPVCPFPSWSV